MNDPAPSPLSTTTLLTHISFVVSVPVLSEQIIVVHPNVWTLGNVLIIAFYLAILLDPSAKHVVMTAGKPFLMIKLKKKYTFWNSSNS